MSLSPPRPLIPVVNCGAIARQVLEEDGDTRVIAVFERSFYLVCPHGIVCIGEAGIGAGPINVEVTGFGERGFTAHGIDVDVEGRTRGAVPRIGGSFALDLTKAVTWTPPAMPLFDPLRVRAGLDALLALTRGKVPSQGLARLILAPDRAPGSTEATMAHGSVRALRDVLPEVVRSGRLHAAVIRNAILLVGLGPGLTPSGDDVLGGLMLALTAADHVRVRDELWNRLAPELDDLTVPVSAMHLSAAADGMGGETVHLLLNAILQGGGPELPRRVEPVARIGHTSGWDTLAGIVLGLEAAL